MATAEHPQVGRRSSGAGGSRRWAWPGLALVLGCGLALRLWGVQQGLPYVYNSDEADHFVPRAIKMFQDGSLNPHYFANPPAFTYLLHYLFDVAYGGHAGVLRTFELHPTQVYTLARVAAALLGVAALWLLYATGARLFGRGVGLLAAAIEAVAFLPVFYAHLALNDVPTLAPLTLCLLASAGVLRKGRTRDYLLAGVGLGLACASKYTAGIVLLCLLAAALARALDADARARPRVAARLALAGAVALLAFLIANPYAALDYTSFHRELAHQSTLSAEAQGKLGAPKDGGFAYYLWSLTWGLGWVPALAALGGAIAIWWAKPRRELRAVGWLLVPAPLAYLLFMGLQGRYFGRWLLPIFPMLCLLGAFFALALARTCAGAIVRRLGGRARPAPHARAPAPVPQALVAALVVLVSVALLAQGVVYSVHSGLVLARADTRNLTRAWMLAHVPRGAVIVAEPVSPDDWARQTPAAPSSQNPYLWVKYPSLLSRLNAHGQLQASVTHEVGIEDYERTLVPALIGYYEQHGYCWVISGSTQSGRAFADPRAVPQAIAYYRALASQGEVVYRSSPYTRGQGPVAFGFDWSFDYYPLAYRRPGPVMTVYRLHGGRCGP
jgi:Dolichyl-phosphate-mannose-protein mannosyltransferase